MEHQRERKRSTTNKVRRLSLSTSSNSNNTPPPPTSGESEKRRLSAPCPLPSPAQRKRKLELEGEQEACIVGDGKEVALSKKKKKQTDFEETSTQQENIVLKNSSSSEEEEEEDQLTPPTYGGKNCPRCDRDFIQDCVSCTIPLCLGDCPAIHRQGCTAANVCAWCGLQPQHPRDVLFACKICDKTLYCSSQCERKHWRHGHDRKCPEMKALLKASKQH